MEHHDALQSMMVLYDVGFTVEYDYLYVGILIEVLGKSMRLTLRLIEIASGMISSA